MKNYILVIFLFSFIGNQFALATQEATTLSSLDTAKQSYSDHFQRMMNIQDSPGAFIAAQIKLSELEDTLTELGVSERELDELRQKQVDSAKSQTAELKTSIQNETELLELASKIPRMSSKEIYHTASNLKKNFPEFGDVLKNIQRIRNKEITNRLVFSIYLADKTKSLTRKSFIDSFIICLEEYILINPLITYREDFITLFDNTSIKNNSSILVEIQKAWILKHPKRNALVFRIFFRHLTDSSNSSHQHRKFVLFLNIMLGVGASVILNQSFQLDGRDVYAITLPIIAVGLLIENYFDIKTYLKSVNETSKKGKKLLSDCYSHLNALRQVK